MKPIALFSLLLTSLTSIATAAIANDTQSSHQILPNAFEPPQVFKNVNVNRNINLEKGYIKESIVALIENVDKAPQAEYYIPFSSDIVSKVGGVQVRDKNKADAAPFASELVEYDGNSPTQFYRITLSPPLAPKAQITLAISYHLLSSLTPLPAEIQQQDKQYLVHTFSSFVPSVYPTLKQRTKLKFPTVDVPEYTGKPERQGSSYTYGPYDNVPAGVTQTERVRYDFTKPVIHTPFLERDVEVSHWGGNVAFEERYNHLTNQGAALVGHLFSRFQWASTQFYKPPTSAIKEFHIPLKPGSLNPYFTDEIGNISTSNFRSGLKESVLDLKPRYPIFGGWNFPFRIGWDADAKNFLRKGKDGSFVLKVPFLEGPKMPEGVSYGKIDLRLILPEGAVYREHSSPIATVAIEHGLHKSFMDTVGRTVIKLTAMNVIDENRENSDVIIVYDYPFSATLRKPFTIFGAILGVFAVAWVIGNLDVSIGKKQAP